MRRLLIASVLIALLGGMQGCGSSSKQLAAQATHHAKEIVECVAAEVARCVALPLEHACPECSRLLRSVTGAPK